MKNTCIMLSFESAKERIASSFGWPLYSRRSKVAMRRLRPISVRQMKYIMYYMKRRRKKILWFIVRRYRVLELGLERISYTNRGSGIRVYIGGNWVLKSAGWRGNGLCQAIWCHIVLNVQLSSFSLFSFLFISLCVCVNYHIMFCGTRLIW